MTSIARKRNRDLDRDFVTLMKPISDTLDDAETSALGAALKAVDAEAKRLETSGLRFDMSNSVLLFALYQYQLITVSAQHQLHQQTGTIAASGAQIGMATMGVMAGSPKGWRDPLPDVILELLRMTTGGRWSTLLRTFGNNGTEIAKIVSRGINAGKGPYSIAALLRQQIGMLRRVAENVARTLQLVAYREAGAATRAANADILEPYSIRIAVLDGRTCVACIGLHGTRIPFDQPVVDHWSGRCDAIPVTKGRVISIQSGEEWLRGLPVTQQRKGGAYQQQIGYANWNAWRQGKVSLSAFGHAAPDDTFGEMLKVHSLKGLLGDAAKNYYKNQAS